MEELDLKELASALKKPCGSIGIQVAEKMNKDNSLINLHVIKQLDLQDNDYILEIGMGNGHFVKDIFNSNGTIHYTGCDISETMVDEAHKINGKFVKNGKADFVLSNAESLPFFDRSFDKVYSVHTIYFWQEPSIVLSEIHRVLKPGGLLSIAIRPKSIMEQYDYTQFGFTLYDKKSIVSLLNDNRFEVYKIVEEEEYIKEIKGRSVSITSLIINGIKK